MTDPRANTLHPITLDTFENVSFHIQDIDLTKTNVLMCIFSPSIFMLCHSALDELEKIANTKHMYTI